MSERPQYKRPARWPLRRRPLTIAALALVALALLLIVVVIAVRIAYADRVLPGATVDGVSIAGESSTEFRRELAAFIDADRPLQVIAGSRQLELKPTEAGYLIDLDASTERVIAAGRKGPLAGAFATLRGLLVRRPVELVANVDEQRLRRAATLVIESFSRGTSVGTLKINPQTLVASATEPRSGIVIDRSDVTKTLNDGLRHRLRQIKVKTRRRPTPSSEQIGNVARAATEYLKAPLQLRSAAGGLSYTIEPRDLAPILAIEAIEGGRKARLGVERVKLAALVELIGKRRDLPARKVRFSAPARPVIVDSKGDLSWSPRATNVTVRKGRPGRRVDRATLTKAITAAVVAGSHSAQLAIRSIEPPLSAANTDRVNRLIGTFTTYYSPGQPRVTNIQTMARAVDGTVVGPGESFSLNAITGERTTAKGYVEAPFIAEGRFQPSVGGGVSQFATTMYNAAFFAGLRIDAHRPHSLYIERYPPGRESTLNFPDIDLRWTNDTSVPVVIRTSSDATSVSVSLYGNNGGRRVSAEAGPRRPVADGNFQITITRVIRSPDGKTVRQPATTRYDNPRPDPEGEAKGN